MKFLCLLNLFVVFIGGLPVRAQTDPAGRMNIYHQGWIDLNKNGRKDIYEDAKANVNARVEDLLRQMNLNEKTNQTATLYGVGRGRSDSDPPLKDELPTPDWKNQIWKDNATYSQFFSDKTTAVHCVFAVSLLRAVRSLKIAIRAIQNKTGSQTKIEEFFAPTDDGWRLHLTRTLSPSCLEPSRRPVIVVPGYGMNGFIFGFHPAGRS